MLYALSLDDDDLFDRPSEDGTHSDIFIGKALYRFLVSGDPVLSSPHRGRCLAAVCLCALEVWVWSFQQSMDRSIVLAVTLHFPADVVSIVCRTRSGAVLVDVLTPSHGPCACTLCVLPPLCDSVTKPSARGTCPECGRRPPGLPWRCPSHCVTRRGSCGR